MSNLDLDEMPLEKALALMTDDWIAAGNYSEYTVARLRDALRNKIGRIEIRSLAFKVASKSCEVLNVDVTAERLWALVEVIAPVLESGLIPGAPGDELDGLELR